MPSAVYQYEFKTDPSGGLNGVFRGTIAQNAAAQIDALLPPTLQDVNGQARFVISSLTIVSIQNLAWEIWIWRKAARNTLTAGVTSGGSDFVGRWTFAAGDAVQEAGTGDFVYYIDGLDIPYSDDDHSGKLHIDLINRSVTGKSSGDAGAVQVKVRGALPIY